MAAPMEAADPSNSPPSLVKRLEARSASSAHEAWCTDGRSAVACCPRGCDGVVVFGLCEGDVRCCSLATGQVSTLGGAQLSTRRDDELDNNATLADGDVLAIWVSHDGRKLCYATRSQLLRYWDCLEWDAEGRLTAAVLQCTVKAHSGPVRVLDVDVSGTLLATGSADGTLKVWDARRSLGCTHSFQHGGVVSEVKHARGSLKIASISASAAFVWDLKTKTRLAKFDHEGTVTALGWLRGRLVTACRDESLRVWDHAQSEDRCVCELVVREEIEAFVVVQDDDDDDGEGRLVSGGGKGRLRSFNMSSSTSRGVSLQEEPSQQQQQEGDVICYANVLSVADKFLAVADDCFEVYDSSLSRDPDCYVGFSDQIADLAFIGSTEVVVATNSSRVRLMRFEDGWKTRLLTGHRDAVLGLDVLEGTVATASKDKTVRVWRRREDDDDYRCVAECVGHVDTVGAVALLRSSNSAMIVVSASRDHTIKRWAGLEDEHDDDIRQLTATCSVSAHLKDVNSVERSNDSLMVATASHDRTVRLFESQKLKPRGTLTGHKRAVWRACFAPSEKLIATCSSDKTVKVWSLASLDCLKTLDGHEDAVLSLSWCADRQLLSASADGVLRLWSNDDATCVFVHQAHNDKVWALGCHNEGELLVVSGANDGSIKTWRDATAEDEAEKRAKEDELEDRQQALRDCLRSGDTEGALGHAFALKRPQAAWQIISDALSSGADLESMMRGWKDPEQTAMECLAMALEWNSNAHRCGVAQRVVSAATRVFGADVVFKEKRTREALRAYTLKHVARLEKLHQASFLIDHALRAVDRHVEELAAEPRDVEEVAAAENKQLHEVIPIADLFDDSLFQEDDEMEEEEAAVVVEPKKKKKKAAPASAAAKKKPATQAKKKRKTF